MANKEEIKKRIEVQQAWADGGRIEWRWAGAKVWNPVRDIDDSTEEDLDTDFEFSKREYRIKREPREVWVVSYWEGLSHSRIGNSGILGNRANKFNSFLSEDDAIRFSVDTYGAKCPVKYREVLKDE